MPVRRLTDEALADIVRRFSAQEDVADIAADHGIAAGTVHVIANRAGASRYRHISDEMRRQVCARRGQPINDIAVEFGISRHAVRRALNHG